MTEATFWMIIKRSRRNAQGDRKRQELNLARELHKLTPDEVVAFDEWFGGFIRAAYNWSLWGAASVISGGCSDDGFWDFRSWLVAQGERIYNNAVEDPESLAKIVDKHDPNLCWLNFLNPAMDVWGEKLGMDEMTTIHKFPSTIASNLDESPAGENPGDTDADLKARYPRLWKKFGA